VSVRRELRLAFALIGEDEGTTLLEVVALLLDLARFGVLGDEGPGRLAGLVGFLKAGDKVFFSEDLTRLCDTACLLVFVSLTVPLCIAA
jgi:hypothetical protein